MFNNFFEKATQAVSSIVGQDEQNRANTSAQNPASGSPVQETPGAEAPAKGDLLSDIVGVAKNVAEAIKEGSQHGGQAVKEGADTTAELTKAKKRSFSEAARDEFDKISQGIGALVGGFRNDDVEAPVTKVDSQGGKVQVTTISGQDGVTAAENSQMISNIKKDPAPPPQSDLLSGVMGLVQNVAGKIQEGAAEGGKTVKEGADTAVDKTKSTASDVSDTTKEGLDKLAEGLSGLVGGILGGKSDNKEAQVPEVDPSFVDSKPVIDDIEGEIPLVKTTGYTLATSDEGTTPGAIAKAKDATIETITSVVDKTKTLGEETAEGTQNLAHDVVDGTRQVGHKAYDATTDAGSAIVGGVKDAGAAIYETAAIGAAKLSSAGEATVDGSKQLGGKVVDTTYAGAQKVADAGEATVDAIKNLFGAPKPAQANPVDAFAGGDAKVMALTSTAVDADEKRDLMAGVMKSDWSTEIDTSLPDPHNHTFGNTSGRVEKH